MCSSDLPPKPADVVAQIEKWRPQRISADEAWTMLPRDESETVVWTTEIREAYLVAYKEPDRNARRMAFRSAYERIVEQNKARNINPEWVISEGWDAEKKAKVLQDAIKLGRIKESDVNPALLEAPSVGKIGRAHV